MLQERIRRYTRHTRLRSTGKRMKLSACGGRHHPGDGDVNGGHHHDHDHGGDGSDCHLRGSATKEVCGCVPCARSTCWWRQHKQTFLFFSFWQPTPDSNRVNRTLRLTTAAEGLLQPRCCSWGYWIPQSFVAVLGWCELCSELQRIDRGLLELARLMQRWRRLHWAPLDLHLRKRWLFEDEWTR